MTTLPDKNIHTGSLILINPEYSFREKTNTQLIPVCDMAPDILLQRDAATLLNRLMEDIGGWRCIAPVSGWRSYEEQHKIWEESLQENGEAFTRKYVAYPGHSEHETGLAIDLGLKQNHIDFIRPDFPNTGICRTFRRLAATYGFILRYPAGKESVTGIGYEPWHFRYVGVPHAEIMVQHALTLEEYIDFIRQYPFGEKPYRLQKNTQELLIGFISESGTAQLPGNRPYTISGNNVDGFILTEWRQ